MVQPTSTGQQAPPESDDMASMLQYVLLVVFVIIPVLTLAVLFATDLHVSLGGALGLNVRQDDHLLIYNATCRPQNNALILNIIYWTADPAPITFAFENFESGVMSSPSGIQTADLTVREQAACPATVRLLDKSRNRESSGPVEVLDS